MELGMEGDHRPVRSPGPEVPKLLNIQMHLEVMGSWEMEDAHGLRAWGWSKRNSRLAQLWRVWKCRRAFCSSMAFAMLPMLLFVRDSPWFQTVY